MRSPWVSPFLQPGKDPLHSLDLNGITSHLAPVWGHSQLNKDASVSSGSLIKADLTGQMVGQTLQQHHLPPDSSNYLNGEFRD